MNIVIEQRAQAGTMQSSDLLVVVEPAEELTVEIESSVEKQFGHLIREQVSESLRRLRVTAGRVVITDQGALDYAIRARVETAIGRAGAPSRDARPGPGRIA